MDDALEKLPKIDLARQLFHRFWHMKPDLEITEPMIALKSTVGAKGLWRRRVCCKTNRKAPHAVDPIQKVALRLLAAKDAWIEATQEADLMFSALPATDLGCLYLDKDLHPVTPNPHHTDFPSLRRHFGSVRGAWPTVAR